MTEDPYSVPDPFVENDPYALAYEPEAEPEIVDRAERRLEPARPSWSLEPLRRRVGRSGRAPFPFASMFIGTCTIAVGTFLGLVAGGTVGPFIFGSTVLMSGLLVVAQCFQPNGGG